MADSMLALIARVHCRHHASLNVAAAPAVLWQSSAKRGLMMSGGMVLVVLLRRWF
jgi:hypothetical protein